MANRLFFDVQSPNMEEKVIVGSFEPNGAAGVPLNVTGLGFTVAKTPSTTGQFVVTLNDEYMQLIAAQADLALATVTHQGVQISTVNVEGSGASSQTVTLTTIDTSSGAAVDISATTGDAVSFEITVLNTKAPPTVSAT